MSADAIPVRLVSRGRVKLFSGRKFEFTLPELDWSGGQIIGIIGPNGAGKSTLLKVLAGHFPAHLVPADAISTQPGQPAWMPAQMNLAFPFTAGDIVMMGRYPLHQGSPGAADHAAVETWLKRAGIFALRDKAYDNLSSGEQRKVSLARTLAAERRIILLDEPFSHLDPQAQVEIADLLRYMRQGGDLIVLSIHDINAALDLCDLILPMKAGKAIAGPLPAAQIDTETLRQTYGGEFIKITANGRTAVIAVSKPIGCESV